MIEVDIPGGAVLRFRHLISDYNGTLACDGKLLPGLAPLIREISEQLEVHVITADTFGIAAQELSTLPVTLKILGPHEQDKLKAEYVRELGPDSCVSLGNGRNDGLMLKESALGICLLEAEGANVATLQMADVVCRSPHDAIALLLNPKRMIATLRT